MHIINVRDYLKLKKTQLIIEDAYDKVIQSPYSEESWEALYHFVFSGNISGVIQETLPNFNWYDPDTTYQEDVCAFISAFSEEMDAIENNNLIIGNYERYN